jgi:hypothetical protein
MMANHHPAIVPETRAKAAAAAVFAVRRRRRVDSPSVAMVGSSSKGATCATFMPTISRQRQSCFTKRGGLFAPAAARMLLDVARLTQIARRVRVRKELRFVVKLRRFAPRGRGMLSRRCTRLRLAAKRHID